MKTMTANNGRLKAVNQPTVAIEPQGAPNYIRMRLDLWQEHKRAKAMAYMALRHGDIAAAMGSMRVVHELRLAIEQTRVDEFKAKAEASVQLLFSAAAKPE